MEAAFSDLQKEGKNDVDNLMKWMKDSNVIDQSKEQEDKARSFFDGVPDPKNIGLDTFTDIIKKVAAEFSKNFEGLAQQLAESGPNLLQSLLGGNTSGGLGGALGGALKNVMPK